VDIPVKVVVGLGNPGTKYQRGRHNLGFMVIDQFARERKVKVREKKYHSLIGGLELNGEEVLLVKPQSYMNRSGEAVRDIVRALPVAAGDLVVIHDDLDLSLGRIRVRHRGGAGGHRGVLSVQEALGDADFNRVRVGIGRPPAGVDPTDFVLSPFSPEEMALVGELLPRAAEAVSTLLQQGCAKAMQIFNQSN